MDNLFDDSVYTGDSVETWVIGKADKWREHYQSNYQEKFEEYPTERKRLIPFIF